jgi:hypothetical protein
LQFALFLAALIWFLCARMLSGSASNGIALRFGLVDAGPLIQAAFLLLLVIVGIVLLRAIEQRRAPLRLTLGLPPRATSRQEWATGAAIGWGLAVASVLPMVLGRALSVEFWTAPRAFWLLGLSLLTLALATLAHAIGVYGYAFPRLVEATGPVRATLIMLAAVAVHAGLVPVAYGTPDGARILVEVLCTLLLALCWLRTHGVWLMWGLHFAWAASTGVLFGLPLGGDASYSSVVDMRTAGPLWLTGGGYGPAAATVSVFLLLAVIPIVVRVSSDWAWSFTHPPIIPGGYDVTIAPPAAHVAMEQAAQTASAGSLVQILPSTPRNPTAGEPPE